MRKRKQAKKVYLSEEVVDALIRSCERNEEILAQLNEFHEEVEIYRKHLRESLKLFADIERNLKKTAQQKDKLIQLYEKFQPILKKLNLDPCVNMGNDGVLENVSYSIFDKAFSSDVALSNETTLRSATSTDALMQWSWIDAVLAELRIAMIRLQGMDEKIQP